LLLRAAALLLLLRLAASRLVAVGAHVLGRRFLRRSGIGTGASAWALPGRGTAFGHGVAAVFTIFVFGHGQTSLGAVAVKLEGMKKVGMKRETERSRSMR
jgi:hypothetical protein